MSSTTTNYGFVKPDYTNFADIEVLGSTIDQIDLTIKTLEQKSTNIQTATGTGTAITLTLPTLVNGFATTFIASANNSGSATNINTKHLYKPNTTTAPNLIAGKAYTVWYDLTSDCFFIKASAEGNTIASHVLANDTFSNDNDTGLTGTMPNNGTLNHSLPINGEYDIPLGYTDGGTITQSIPVKTTQTYQPSTSQQTISSGQYLSGNQVIAPVTGDTTVNDVVAGKTFSSSNGINLVGQATIESLGGKRFSIQQNLSAPSGLTTITVGFQPSTVMIRQIVSGTTYTCVTSPIGNITASVDTSGSNAILTNDFITITSTGFTFNPAYFASWSYICYE